MNQKIKKIYKIVFSFNKIQKKLNAINKKLIINKIIRVN